MWRVCMCVFLGGYACVILHGNTNVHIICTFTVLCLC